MATVEKEEIKDKLAKLNKEIKERYDKSKKYDDQLSDKKLYKLYKKSESTKKKYKEIKNQLIPLFNKYNIDEKNINDTNDEFTITINGEMQLLDLAMSIILPYLIPAGTKGVIRGNKFNKIVENYILKQINDNKHLILETEQEIDFLTEKADWILTNTNNNKKLIGYNQLDMWSGGQQSDRAGKFITNSNISKKCKKHNSKLICIIVRYPETIKSENKKYNLFFEGFKNKTLYYLEDLHDVIINFI